MSNAIVLRNPIPFWDGPSFIVLFLLIGSLGAFALGISMVAINGFPKLSWGKNKFPVTGRTILITGGSTGLGLELGNVFSHKGANVILVARNSAQLEKAVNYISESAPHPETQRFHWISADVTSASENERLLAEATEWNGGSPPDVIWANAGAAVPGYFMDLSTETLRQQMDLNYWAAVYLAKASFKAWLESPIKGHKDSKGRPARPPTRHFCMTSSVAAFCGLAGYSGYSPTKAALRSLHDQLRNELQLYNGYLGHPRNVTIPKMKVHSVFPGTILSPGLDRENETKPPVLKMLEEGDPAQKPFEIAVEAIRQLEKGRSMIVTQWLAGIMKASALGGSMRDSSVMDTLTAWVGNVAWCFIAPDMEKKVKKWGELNGMSLKQQ